MKSKDNNIKINTEVKTPWYETYDKLGIKHHLDYPEGSMYDLLVKSALKNPDNEAFEYFGNATTYKELLKEIKRCASALKKIGIKKGDKVTICMPNTPEAVISFYAVNAIGAVSSMVHPLSSEGEIKYYVELSESKIAIAIDISYEKFKKLIGTTTLEKVIVPTINESMGRALSIGYWLTKGRKIPNIDYNEATIPWKKFIKYGDNEIGAYVEVKKEETAAILYSGGTTGTPKGIVLSNYNFNVLAYQALEVETITSEDSIIGILPLFHGFGLGVATHTILYCGAKIYLMPQMDLKQFVNILLKKKITFIVAVPTLYEALMTHEDLKDVDLSFIKTIISGGDTLTVALKEKFDKFLRDHNSDVEVREGYGTTECVTASCLVPPGVNKPGSIGIPFPDTYYKVVEPHTENEVPYGEDGEICLSGPSVMVEYLNNPEETASTLIKHEDGKVWLHTGDIGYMDKDGFLYFKLRLKRMIVSNGYNIYPTFIENVINTHPSVLTCTVVGVDDPHKKQVAKAFIVLKPDIVLTKELENDIKRLCEKNISKFSMPKEFEYRESLPKTLVGKVDYKVLEAESKAKANEKLVSLKK